jgi:hypothetical protein
MKKECAHTRKALPKYLHGHLFKLEQIRIERHLRSCVVCHSQYQALKRSAETKQFLRDITPPEGVVQRMKESVSGLAKLKKVLYRPLWLAGIVVVAAVIYHYATLPRQLDVELDNIVKTAPTSTAPVTPVPPTPAPAPVEVAPPRALEPAKAMEPLPVTITTENDKAAIRRINEIMRGHGQLRKLRFSDTVREISGSLTAKELLTFFNRIEPAGKISYSRKRFESFPSAQTIPFVMKMIVAPTAPEQKASSAKPAPKPAEASAPAPPAPPLTAPTPTVR